MPMEFIASYSTPRKTEETRKKNIFKLTVEQFEKDNKAKFGEADGSKTKANGRS